MTDTPKTELERLQERAKALQLKIAQTKLADQRREARAASQKKRAEKRAVHKILNADRRAEDAHKKIILGGLLVAVGADKYNEAELAGLILEALPRVNDGNKDRYRISGATYLKERAEAAGRTWKMQWDGKNVLLDIDAPKPAGRKPAASKSGKAAKATSADVALPDKGPLFSEADMAELTAGLPPASPLSGAANNTALDGQAMAAASEKPDLAATSEKSILGSLNPFKNEKKH